MRLAVLLGLAGLGLLVGTAWAGPRATVEAVYASGAYQTEHPTPRTPPSIGPDERAQPGGDDAGRGSVRREPARAPASPGGGGSADLGRVLTWMLVGVAAVLLLLTLARAVLDARNRGARRAEAPAAAAVRTDVHPAPPPLDEADRLAAAGRFGDAVHALLLRAHRRLAAAQALPTSLTSREVLARTKVERDARAAFETLVAAVERFHFGGRPATEAEFRAARTAQERFLAGLEPAGTA